MKENVHWFVSFQAYFCAGINFGRGLLSQLCCLTLTVILLGIDGSVLSSSHNCSYNLQYYINACMLNTKLISFKCRLHLLFAFVVVVILMESLEDLAVIGN